MMHAGTQTHTHACMHTRPHIDTSAILHDNARIFTSYLQLAVEVLLGARELRSQLLPFC